jgi:hypothetical protein
MRMHRVRIGMGIVAFGLIAGASAVLARSDQGSAGPRPEAAGGVTLLVPAYFYPSSQRRADWTRLAEAARSVPLEVILNPASGPGPRRDPNYVAVLEPLRRSGARILGYVDSDYGRRPLAAVEQDLRTYRRFYEIDGVFIDQMANTVDAVDYYRAIRRLIRAIDPRLKVVGNPGTSTLPEYLDTADTLVTFEGGARTFAGYTPRAALSWTADHPASRFGAIVYDVRTPSDGRDALSRAIRSGAGSIYITDQNMPNPYLGLPPYWADQIAAVRSANRPHVPGEATPSRPGP